MSHRLGICKTFVCPFNSKVTDWRSILVTRAPPIDSPTDKVFPFSTTEGFDSRKKIPCNFRAGNSVGAGPAAGGPGGTTIGGFVLISGTAASTTGG